MIILYQLLELKFYFTYKYIQSKFITFKTNSYQTNYHDMMLFRKRFDSFSLLKAIRDLGAYVAKMFPMQKKY